MIEPLPPLRVSRWLNVDTPLRLEMLRGRVVLSTPTGGCATAISASRST
jgi:hypothetical protein